RMAHEDRTADRRAIERLVDSLADAWGRGDAAAFASRFADDGSFANVVGMFFRGRDAFRDRHDAVFKTLFRGSTLSLGIASLRFIRPDVAIADLDAALRGFEALPAGLNAMADGTVRTRLLMVLAKEQGEWWISAYHNVAVVPQPPKR